MARWDANLEIVRRASLPQLQNVLTAKGMHFHPNSSHLGPLVRSLRVSAAVEAAPDELHDSLSMAGQRGDVTVTSKVAGLSLSHPAMHICRSGVAVISCKTMTLLHTHTQMSSPTEVHKDITQVIVPYHHISPMPAGYSMVTQGIKSHILAKGAHSPTNTHT